MFDVPVGGTRTHHMIRFVTIHKTLHKIDARYDTVHDDPLDTRQTFRYTCTRTNQHGGSTTRCRTSVGGWSTGIPSRVSKRATVFFFFAVQRLRLLSTEGDRYRHRFAVLVALPDSSLLVFTQRGPGSTIKSSSFFTQRGLGFASTVSSNIFIFIKPGLNHTLKIFPFSLNLVFASLRYSPRLH